MNIFELMDNSKQYYSDNRDMPLELQKKAKRLCFKYNNTSVDDDKLRADILSKLLGTYNPLVFVEPDFRCDYGFNIHTKGLTVINYNCVILDTSRVEIGENVFIGPNSVIACSGHAINYLQRAQGIGYSKPITLKDNVWLGASVTICPGVTIGENSVIGAGSVVTKDIPSNVIAAGNPCKVIREITDNDIIEKDKIFENFI